MSNDKIAYIENIMFINKQNIPWNQVEPYFGMPVQGSDEKKKE